VRCRRLDMRESLCGIRDSPAQLTPDVVWDPEFRSGCASCVAMMLPAHHREGDDFPSIDGLALAGLGVQTVELAPRLQARSGGGEQGVQQGRIGG
jgi:hypothetical protein